MFRYKYFAGLIHLIFVRNCLIAHMVLVSFRNIVIAMDGVEATIKLQNQLFSVILLDLNLLNKNGSVIMKQIKELGNNKLRRIVVVSGEMGKNFIA